MKCVLAPIGSAGDVYPYLGLGQALSLRGHHVVVLTNGYFREVVERLGFTFQPVSTAEEFLQVVSDPEIWQPFRGPIAVMRYALRLVEPLYRAVMQEYLPGETVVLTSCLGWGARIAQEVHQISLATVDLQPSVLWSYQSPPALPGIGSCRWFPRWCKNLIFAAGVRWVLDPICCPTLNRFRADLGLAPFHGTSLWWHSTTRILGLFPSWYASPPSDWPAQFRQAQFPIWDEAFDQALPDRVEEFLAAGDPPIVFTPGSANVAGAEFFRTAAESCRRLGRRGLLLTRFAKQIPSVLPPGVRHVEFASFGKLLPRAAAIVHHGGIGTTAHALAAGIPQVITPFSHDQPDNAERIQRLGAGASIPRKRLTTERLSSILLRVCSCPRTLDACRLARQRISHVEPFAEACTVVEEMPLR
jgi:UDP:flavonoid glycosyltransferase YjiC (YdhE family)